jgi:hypothetical protein
LLDYFPFFSKLLHAFEDLREVLHLSNFEMQDNPSIPCIAWMNMEKMETNGLAQALVQIYVETHFPWMSESRKKYLCALTHGTHLFKRLRVFSYFPMEEPRNGWSGKLYVLTVMKKVWGNHSTFDCPCGLNSLYLISNSIHNLPL